MAGSPRLRRFGPLGVAALAVTLASSVLAVRPPPSAAASGPGCWVAVSPSAGPVGTLVSITGSTATCADGGYGGDFGFVDENAGVSIASLPGHGGFSYTYRIPVAMPAGDWWAAAQSYVGGGPVAPGPASFVATMGAALSARFTVTSAPPGWADFTSIMSTPPGCPSCYQFSAAGYDLVRAGGFVDTFIGAPNSVGYAGDMRLAAPVVASAFTTDGGGYWMLGADGGVFTYGNASFFGSAANDHPASPMVGISRTHDGHGYWLVDRNGGVFSFGNAGYHGRVWYTGAPCGPPPPTGSGTDCELPPGDQVSTALVVGMASTSDGAGYWIATSDGSVFSFGDAVPYGSMGGRHLNAPVVGMAATPDGHGYWLVGADGGVFSFGDAGFHGAAVEVSPFPMVGLAPTPDGAGYWLAASDGGVFTYGDAHFAGAGRS